MTDACGGVRVELGCVIALLCKMLEACCSQELQKALKYLILKHVIEDFLSCGSITRHPSRVEKKRDKQATKTAEATFQVRVLLAEQMAALNILPE